MLLILPSNGLDSAGEMWQAGLGQHLDEEYEGMGRTNVVGQKHDSKQQPVLLCLLRGMGIILLMLKVEISRATFSEVLTVGFFKSMF